MIKVLLCGCTGRMGKFVEKEIEAVGEMEILAGVGRDENARIPSPYPIYNSIQEVVEKCDVIIDFSHFSLAQEVLTYAQKTKTPLILCTTGLEAETLNQVEETSKSVAIVRSYNMSVGINLIDTVLKEISNKLYNLDFDIEVVEKHHKNKIDAPSGTAIMFANTMKEALYVNTELTYDRTKRKEKRKKEEIGISSVRGGSIPGEHSILFAGSDEVIEIKHTALSPVIFVKGAVLAAKWILGKEKGLYTMKDVLK